MSLTNRTSFKTAQADGIVDADGFASLGQNYIIDSTNAITAVFPTYTKVATVSLAQLNAGLTLIADIPGRTIVPVDYLIVVNGTFLTATDIRLQDSNGSPVLLTTALIAAVTAGAKLSNDVVIANVTDGAGMYASLTAGKGIQIVKTGSAATGGTSLLVRIQYYII
jgi:hypothetical protein